MQTRRELRIVAAAAAADLARRWMLKARPDQPEEAAKEAAKAAAELSHAIVQRMGGDSSEAEQFVMLNELQYLVLKDAGELPDVQVDLNYCRIRTDRTINFEKNKAKIENEAETRAMLEQVATVCKLVRRLAAAKGFEPVKVLVEGHTNVKKWPPTDKKKEQHRGLSESRSKKVMKELKALGVPKEMLRGVGRGCSKPLKKGSEINQRVEFVVEFEG